MNIRKKVCGLGLVSILWASCNKTYNDFARTQTTIQGEHFVLNLQGKERFGRIFAYDVDGDGSIDEAICINAPNTERIKYSNITPEAIGRCLIPAAYWQHLVTPQFAGKRELQLFNTKKTDIMTSDQLATFSAICKIAYGSH